MSDFTYYNASDFICFLCSDKKRMKEQVFLESEMAILKPPNDQCII